MPFSFLCPYPLLSLFLPFYVYIYIYYWLSFDFFPCPALSSLLVPLSLEPAISSFPCFRLPADSLPSHHGRYAILVFPSSIPYCPSFFVCVHIDIYIYISYWLSYVSSLALLFPLFWFLFHVNLLSLLPP